MRSRAISNGCALHLGRTPEDGGFSVKGRVCMDLKRFLAYGIEGACERSRWTMAPPGLACRWPAGKTIDSRQRYEALKRGILIPNRGRFHIYGGSALETAIRDRGGLVIAPKAGLHENVAELDFESMFPSIMVKHNISYETVAQDGIDASRKGLLPALIETVLYRRLRLKHLRNAFPEGSLEWFWCENRQKALKEILVCIYGYSGCFANRFGNVKCFEETNRLARETLLKAMNIALDRGFEVIYGDSDSLFVKKSGALREDYEELAALSSATGLPITLSRHYRFVVFLKQKAKLHAEARRYYGRLMDGKIYCRGVEMRRGDTPLYIREFQERLIEILLDAETKEEVLKRRVKMAINYVSEVRRKILRGKVSPADLAFSRVLRRKPSEYRSRQPHAVAAEQLTLASGKAVSKGVIEFLYVNSKHKNPYRRVAPNTPGLKRYDREKYADLILKAAETILSPIREKLSFNGPLSYGLDRFL
jgi:DNA polymerase elongation subunit (family B)